MKTDFRCINMSKLSILVMACALSLGTTCMQASVKIPPEDIKHAVRILKNIDTDQSKDWAISLLRKAADNDTLAYAMNTLGLAYMAGAGVEQDSAQAVAWLEKAGAHGYSEAYHNLGMMYKDGGGVAQNFAKAYDAFRRGAENSSVVCKYDEGFMLYKGLGCGQDYIRAARLFDDAISKIEHTPSMYMLGLCYRNGYGVPRDSARAGQLLDRAAMLSFGPAMEELRRSRPENYLGEMYGEDGVDAEAPAQMPEISAEVNDTSLIYGMHSGFIVMYDWSGKFVLGEKPVTMDIRRAGEGKAAGRMILAGDTVAFKADITADGRLLFSKGNVRLNERYNIGQKTNYRMDNAVLDVWKDKIFGRLNLYSLNLKEPERPMYIELSRISMHGNSVDADQRFTHIHATPNPFRHEFTATFELQEQCNAQVRIFDQAGRMVYTRSLGTMSAGKHDAAIAPQIKDGTYVLNIKAGKQILRAIIVKKGDAL